MTPISFALEILLDCETIEEAHKKCRKYIKQLESNQIPQQRITSTAVIRPDRPQIEQAPSTQRALERHGIDAAPAPILPTPSIRAPMAGIDKETGRPMIVTGNGTKGPRKF